MRMVSDDVDVRANYDAPQQATATVRQPTDALNAFVATTLLMPMATAFVTTLCWLHRQRS